MSSNNFQELEIRFNCEVNKVHDWLLANKLSIHYTDKTQYMLIKGSHLSKNKGPDTNFKLCMGDHEIEKTDNYKYLGIIIDDKLNWKPQINKLCSKLSSVCGVLSKVRHYLDRESLMLIYNSLFDSRLRYGILSWGTASDDSLAKLKVLQNRAVRFITFSPFRTSMSPLYSTLKIIPLEKQLFLQRAIFMHSLHYKNVPMALSTYCHQPQHNYGTRYKTSSNYVLPVSRTNRGQCSIKYAGPKVWANVPKQYKQIAFRKPFAKKLKEHVLGEIYEDLPPQSSQASRFMDQNDHPDEMITLFESDDEEEEFLGFGTPETEPDISDKKQNEELAALFQSDEEDEDDFLGFGAPDSPIKHPTNTEAHDQLITLFESDPEDNFMGFDSLERELDTLFLTDTEDGDFLGF